MKTTFVSLVLCLSTFSAVAHAGCEDGAGLAEQAVKSTIKKRFPGFNLNQCAATADESSAKSTSTGEIWIVDFACSTGLASKFKVVLVEEEDAVCTAKTPQSIPLSE